MFILNLLLETNRFYLLNSVRDCLCKPLFLPKKKTRKHDVTLTSFMTDVSNLTSFLFVGMCKIDSLEGIGNLAIIRTSLREILQKNGGEQK